MGLRVNKRGFAKCSGLEEIDLNTCNTCNNCNTCNTRVPDARRLFYNVENSKSTLRSPERCGFWISRFSFTMEYGLLGFAHQKRLSLSGSEGHSLYSLPTSESDIFFFAQKSRAKWHGFMNLIA
jgi:hypothetical protein